MAKAGRASKAARDRKTGREKAGNGGSESPADVADTPAAEPSSVDADHPVVVGIGASAGGLEAFTRLLSSLPASPGAAFVFVQHLSPDHESALPALLARATPMPVAEARDRAPLAVDHVHVIPPNMDIAIEDGHLRLIPRPPRSTPHMPLDLFLSTLAEAHGNRAIGVILSGTGSDGTLGCKALKGAGGIAMAQEPSTARYDGMPRSVIAEGCVDFVLPPEGIAQEIVRLARQPYVRAPLPPESVAPVAAEKAALPRVFAIVARATRADFSSYKKTTVLRRIQRRMVLHGIDRLADYVKLLESDTAEVLALHHDLLIHVTSFFRDPSTFKALAARLPALLRGRETSAPVRVWIPGCATGEEAYSMAMCVLESLSDVPANPPVQIFATDLSESAIEKARSGTYLPNIAADVSPERLARFFVKVDGSYQVSKTVRDLIVFARQDMTRDPPFSRLDLVSCRNVLIYLEPALQRRVLSTFHYALGPDGLLVLGRSETVGASSDLFDLADKEHRIYTKIAGESPLAVRPGLAAAAAPDAEAEPPARGRAELPDVGREAERLLLDRYAPASVLVDDAARVLHFRGDVNRFLGHPRGAATHDLMGMAPVEILPDLRRLLHEARARGVPRRKDGLVAVQRGKSRRLSLEVIPMKEPASGDRRFLVVFEEADPPRARGAAMAARPRPGKAEQTRIAALEAELAAFRSFLSSSEGERAASREEMQSANEEVLSTNEELQSINEELQTAKEELQSGNEELITLNDELRNRNFELQRLTDDLDNLVASATIPLVMLGRDLVVRRFTAAAASVLGLQASDVGRPLANVRTGIPAADLEQMLFAAMAGADTPEREFEDREGRWWRLHVRPFRTRSKEVEGAVLVLVDVDALKRNRDVVEDARDFSDAIVNTVRQPLIVLTADLRVRRVNRAFVDAFAMLGGAAEGASLYEIGDGQWDVPAVRNALEGALGRVDSFEGHAVELELPGAGRRILKLNGRRLRQDRGKDEMILVGIEDVTDAAQLEQQRTELMRRSEEATTAAIAANKIKDEFVATASHELRGPLNAMVGWVHVLSGPNVDDALRGRALAAIERSVKAQTRLVAELLDVTRIMAGKLHLSMRMVELIEVIETAVQAVRPTALAKNVEISLAPGLHPETVLGDPDRLYQVVWNILSNAVKFTPRGGRVEIDMGRAATSTRITVTDTGQGITADFLPHVFERFRQGDGSATRSQPGLGLGLAIVRQLVEMHGGTVSAMSEGPGRGSRFEVFLPVPALRMDPAGDLDGLAAPVLRAETGPDLSGLRVLIVDDDPDGREVLCTVLERHGATVASAASVEAALSAFALDIPDVLISDVGMPDLDGHDLMREIRKRATGAGGGVPALALTAYAGEGDRDLATSAGFDAYLAKPAHPADLLAAIASLARRS